MLEASPRLKKEAKKISCEPNHIILADLILSSYTEAEAYDIAYSENIAFSAKKKIEDRERVFSSEGYKRAYENRKRMRKYNTEDVEVRDKDDIVKELNTIVNQAGTDPKLKAEILLKIADLQQMKKGVSGNEDPVQFFFPISCEKCPLLQRYNQVIAKKNEGRPRDDLDYELKPDELQRLIEQQAKDVKDMRRKEIAGY